MPMIDLAQIDPAKLHELNTDQLRELTRELLARTERDGREIGWRDAKCVFQRLWTPISG